MRPVAWLVGIALAIAACTHSDSFQYDLPDAGPAPVSNGAVRLTFNGDQDYWPTLAEDSTVILYAYVDSVVGSVAGGNPPSFDHRCMGALPSAGGTRFWQACDSRLVMADSLTTFTAFALGRDGRLLYAEGAADFHQPLFNETTLWLADSAHPFNRREVARLPFVVGDSVANWISTLQWTGPATFTALAEDQQFEEHCPGCTSCDSLFFGLGVVTGSTNASGFALIRGTEGASSYSLAANGADVVFTRRNDLHLYSVPIGGGVATTVATVSTDPSAQLLGVSCRGVVCVVATGSVHPAVLASGALRQRSLVSLQASACGDASRFLTFPVRDPAGTFDVRSVSLATGAVTALATAKLSAPSVYALPLLLANGDVAVQVGESFGPLQTLSSSSVDLWLLPRVAAASH